MNTSNEELERLACRMDQFVSEYERATKLTRMELMNPLKESQEKQDDCVAIAQILRNLKKRKDVLHSVSRTNTISALKAMGEIQ